MQFAKLIDKNGHNIQKPKAIEGSVSYDLSSGKAHAWAADGKTLLAEMVGVRVVWITAVGIRLEGQEPYDIQGTKFKLQAWQLRF